MAPVDPMAVAVDWLDAYRAARINQIVGMYSPDAVIECACGGRKIIHGQEDIAAYWRQRFNEMPALELEDLQGDGGAVVISYRTNSGTVQARLDIAEDGMINRCRCGPV
jgi:ketosteroid isomerase-like protein